MTAFATYYDAIGYIQSGNVRFSIQSKKTGTTFDYQVKESSNGKYFSVAFIAGPSTVPMGAIVNGQFKHTPAARMQPTYPAYKAFAWLWAQLCINRLPADIIIVGKSVQKPAGPLPKTPALL